MKQRVTKLKKDISQPLYGLIFAGIFATIGVIFVVFSRAATPGTLTLSPTGTTTKAGSQFTVTISENSLTDTVNAVQADLTYDPAKLEFVSANTGTDVNSPFEVEAQNTGGNGKVNIAVGSITPRTGSQIVGTVTFKALTTGSATVAFANTSLLITNDDNENILSGTTGGTYTFTDGTAPSTPSSLTLTSVTATTAKISWAPSSDNVAVAGYYVYRNGTQVGNVPAVANSANIITYTDSGLKPKTAYSYTVAAYDAAGNKSAVQTTPLTATTTADVTAPSAPGSIVKGAATINSIGFTWAAASDDIGVTGYNVYRGNTKIASNITTTSYTDTASLLPGTSYSYAVTAVDAAGNESAKSALTALATLPDSALPSIPSGVSITGQTTSSVSLSWAASSDNIGITGYYVYRNGVQVANVTTGTAYTDSNVAPGTYKYTVAAYDAAKNVSSQSAALTTIVRIKQADVNNDGVVNIFDLSILLNSFNKTDMSVANIKASDLNNDQVVNIFDLSILINGFGK